MGAFRFQGRQVFHALVIEAGPARAGSAGFLEVAFHGAMRVPVVFHHRQPNLARGPDGLNDFLNLLVLSRTVVDCGRKALDHQITEREAVSLEAIAQVAEAVFLPGNARAAGNHIIYAELADLASAAFVALSRGGA